MFGEICVIRHGVGLAGVIEVVAAGMSELGRNSSDHGGRGTLLDCLVGEQPGRLGRIQRLPLFGREVPPKAGGDPARVGGVGDDPVVSPPPRRVYGEEGVGRLRLRIGDLRVILATFELRVFEIDPCTHVRCRAEGDDSGSVALLGTSAQCVVEAEGEGEMTQVVRCELQFPPFGSPPETVRHETGIVDEKVKGTIPFGNELGDRTLVGQVESSDRRSDPSDRLDDVASYGVAGDRVPNRESDIRAD